MSIHAPNHLLWVLPLVFLTAGSFWYASRQRRQAIALLSGDAGTCHLKSNASPRRRKILTVLLFTSLILAAFAALRPIQGTIISEFERPAKNIIILADVSKSMGAKDADGLTRMEAAKLLAREFVNRRPTDRIGLLSFAGASYPECPVTLSRTNLLSRIDKLHPGSLRIPGTDLEAAFQEARNLLTEEPPPGSAVIILSDGDNLTGRHQKIIESFAKSGVPVLAVGFGNPSIPAAVPNSVYDTQANFGVLKEISEATEGIFLAGKPAQVDVQIEELATRVDSIELSGENIAPEIYSRPLDLYAYPLSIALICLLVHLFLPLKTKNWHPLTAALTVALLLFLLPKPTQAQEKEAAENLLDSFEKMTLPHPPYDEAKARALEEGKPLLLIFTGSDWSALSITFEEEILSHVTYQDWEKRTVIPLIVDFTRSGTDENRTLNRALANRFDIASYPYAIFVDPEGEQELGRLTHEVKGPAEWVRRANAILAGDQSQSDTAASVDYLPKEDRAALENPNLTLVERSIGYYNKALEIERADPELAIKSKDRFKLLNELFDLATQEAPDQRPDLAFSAQLKLGILQHNLGRSLLPEDLEDMAQEDQMRLAAESKGDIIKLLKKVQKHYRDALSNYRQAAPLQPNDEQLSTNLAVVYRDLDRVKAYIDFQTALQTAIEETGRVLAQEKRFRKSLAFEVTSKKPINDKGVDRSVAAIQKLVQSAQAISDKPTILDEKRFAEFKLAKEDIDLAPATHSNRHLSPSVQHIQDAYDHLVDPQQQQSGSQGEGAGEPQEGEEGGGENEEEAGGAEPQGDIPDAGDEAGEEEKGGEGSTGDSDADLRRSEKEGGDLRDRLLDRLQRENRRRPRGKDH